MPDFNFKPSITEFSFYRGQRDFPEDKYITEIKLLPREEESVDVFELGMRLTLSGLDYLRHPLFPADKMDDNYLPFFLHIATYTQRGQRDFVVDGVRTHYISKEMMEKGSVKIQLTLTKFNNVDSLRFPDDNHDFEYDFISNILFLRVFMTRENIEDAEVLEEEMFQPYNLLFETKIPKIDMKAWEWDRGGLDF